MDRFNKQSVVINILWTALDIFADLFHLPNWMKATFRRHSAVNIVCEWRKLCLSPEPCLLLTGTSHPIRTKFYSLVFWTLPPYPPKPTLLPQHSILTLFSASRFHPSKCLLFPAKFSTKLWKSVEFIYTMDLNNKILKK